MMENPFELIDRRLSGIEEMLIEIINVLKEGDSSGGLDKWFSIEELCLYLPGKPSKQTIYAKVSKRLIPHKKFGKRLAFRKSEIDEWLMSQSQKTVSEIVNESVRNCRKS